MDTGTVALSNAQPKLDYDVLYLIFKWTDDRQTAFNMILLDKYFYNNYIKGNHASYRHVFDMSIRELFNTVINSIYRSLLPPKDKIDGGGGVLMYNVLKSNVLASLDFHPFVHRHRVHIFYMVLSTGAEHLLECILSLNFVRKGDSICVKIEFDTNRLLSFSGRLYSFHYVKQVGEVIEEYFKQP